MSGRILVIDDDRAVRLAFDYALRDEGYLVETAADAAEAERRVREGTPDLVFLDLRLPAIDGIEVLTRLRRQLPNVPVYVVTAYHDQYFDSLRHARNSGLSFEIAEKPLSDDQIRQIVRGVFGGGEAAAVHYVLRLYLAGMQVGGDAIRTLFTRHLRESGISYEIEVVDVLSDPGRAAADRVFATPTLLRVSPGPPQRVVGDLQNVPAVLVLLGIYVDQT